MAEALDSLLAQLEPEIEDPEEEAFLLFSQTHPSQNLGFIDAKATDLELTVNGQDLTITQSPAVLSSNRAGGTTGAVVWKVTPLFASWLSSPSSNMLFRTGLLGSASTILELGCGVSALVGLAAGPLVRRYVLTDQQYVARFVEHNISQNQVRRSTAKPKRKGGGGGSGGNGSGSSSGGGGGGGGGGGNVTFHPLDWELDTPTTGLCVPDVVVACDCIYNEALIPPFVQACADACRLQSSGHTGGDNEDGSHAGSGRRPCVCVVAQQLRDPEIFEGWLKEFVRKGFRSWRVPDAELPEGLRSSSGFVVHIGILKEAFERQ